ncbi:hypothetical protein D3C71_2049370 [compost metagenome]
MVAFCSSTSPLETDSNTRPNGAVVTIVRLRSSLSMIRCERAKPGLNIFLSMSNNTAQTKPIINSTAPM